MGRITIALAIGCLALLTGAVGVIVNYTAIKALETRVDALETWIMSMGKDVAELEHTIGNFTWMRAPENNVFDCSEMSAYLWQYLTNRGWKCAIVLGYYHVRYHAWLLVNTVDEFITPVEATKLRAIRINDTEYEGYLQFKKFFPTLQDALDWDHQDFDYWNSYPYAP